MAALAAPLAVAIEATLRASPSLAAAMSVVRLYTVVPVNAPLPYVIVGENQIVGDDIECAEGAEAFVVIHVHAHPNPPSIDSPNQIADAVRATLTAPFILPEHEVVEWQFDGMIPTIDPDGSSHIRLTFRYLLTEIVSA